MRRDQRAGAIEERRAVCREPDRAWRALDETFSQQCLQPLQLEADGRLSRAKRFCGPRKTLEVGDQQEGLDGGDVERCCHYDILSLVSTEIRYQNVEGGSSFSPTPRNTCATSEENDYAADHRVLHHLPPVALAEGRHRERRVRAHRKNPAQGS